jgi:hypothetical protein
MEKLFVEIALGLNAVVALGAVYLWLFKRAFFNELVRIVRILK